MINSELIEYLKQFPLDTPIKLMFGQYASQDPVDLEQENILYTSETATADDSYPEEEWDCEAGKIIMGDGEMYLLINPIIV